MTSIFSTELSALRRGFGAIADEVRQFIAGDGAYDPDYCGRDPLAFAYMLPCLGWTDRRRRQVLGDFLSNDGRAS